VEALSLASRTGGPDGPPEAIGAVIFDCDGTLVDSETLSAEVIAECLAPHGLSYTAEAALAAFRGRHLTAVFREAEDRIGRKLPVDFEAFVRARAAEAFRARLREIEGATALLEALSLPVCVATNGPRHKTELTLAVTGLRRFFGEHVYCAYDIGAWKPDPGLFLHAAAALGVAPARCLVVEDSQAGVTAGLAAGMRVVALLAHGEPAPWLPERVPAIARLGDLHAHLP
jgi:HAD superfamily hydrolase (TIGR01509 family)